MRVSPGAIVWTLLVLGGASLVGQVVRVLSIDVDETLQDDKNDRNQSRGPHDSLGSSDDHILWFMQVSGSILKGSCFYFICCFL